MLTGIEKFAGDQARSRAFSPKFLALNLAVVSAKLGTNFYTAMNEREVWGRLVESAIGAHLHNYKSSKVALHYWRERVEEVDFVLSHGAKLTAIEVKSGRNRGVRARLKKFTHLYETSKPLIVGTDDVPIEGFLLAAPDDWL